MTHYLIQLSQRHQDPGAFQWDSWRCLSLAQEAARRVGGNVGCYWINGERNGMATILHVDGEPDPSAVRNVFEQIEPGSEAAVMPVAAARETPGDWEDAVIEFSLEYPDDPVDLGSTLSFPCSDPPTWIWGQAPASSLDVPRGGEHLQ